MDSIDIGNVGIAGSASEFGTGDLVIKGSGNGKLEFHLLTERL